MEFTTEYREEFAEIAFKKLSNVPLRDENILCLVFRCSKQTIALWKSDHLEFKQAIELGLMTGEYKFRELLFALAMCPSKKVNTKLLTTLASNVYDINEEQVQMIQSAISGDHKSVESKLKSLGIPIPQLAVEDLGE